MMQFTSTRKKQNIESAEAICKGLSSEGGLFVPKTFPKLSDEVLDKMADMNYKERAFEVLKLYLTDFTDEEIKYCVSGAYDNTFDDNKPAPVVEVKKGENILELWHGPTCAFKDMALQLLPYCLQQLLC